MVKNIPFEFKRVAAMFNERSRARQSPCESSSGSEHSPDSSYNLTDLVNNFIEAACRGNDNEEIEILEEDGSKSCLSAKSDALIEELKILFCNVDYDQTREKIIVETRAALEEIGEQYDEDFKRRLMIRLRYRGIDAGLCKSRWEKQGTKPAGSYEYIDVNNNANSKRYIVEVSLAKEFEIARPTDNYKSMLNSIPQIYIGKPEELKNVTRLMCRLMKESMKSSSMEIPPWRRYAFVQAKWFASYKRTTKKSSSKSKSKNDNENVVRSSVVGFEAAFQARNYNCRDFTHRDKRKLGLLTAALTGMQL